MNCFGWLGIVLLISGVSSGFIAFFAITEIFK